MPHFKSYELDQIFLMPPSIRDWLPEEHLANFISDVVDEMDLSAFYRAYAGEDDRGRPAYQPVMLVKLLLYAYCTGKPSSRKIEKATYEDVAYRILAANQHPDHDTIAAFRRRHLQDLAALFLQVLALCQESGLVKLGHVALDGTKIKANASKHKAMSYDRMCETEKKLVEEIARLLKLAEEVDVAEDQQIGKGKSETDLPAELARRESRLAKIREAKQALEEEAKARAEAQAEEARAKIEERKRQEQETGKKLGGSQPKIPEPEEAKPEPKAQRNFTDPDSRIMKDGSSKGFEQAYNAQIVVDGEAQVIVAADLTQEANDKQQLVPMLLKVEENTGQEPEKASADSGYFSEKNITSEQLKNVDLYVPPDRQKHGQQENIVAGTADPTLTIQDQMRHKLRTADGQAVYKLRKAIVEPVFGQIKEARGLRRFSFRGKLNVRAEWLIICLTHNLLKLFRAVVSPQGTPNGLRTCCVPA